MQKIVPHLWFDKEAKEASRFYTSVFGKDSKVISVTTLHDTPSGDVDTVTFEIWGYKFMAISAGPLFKFNPSISFMVNFDPSQDHDARKRIDDIWEKLIDEGEALMPIEKYDFSERYGWVKDKYGVSWQIVPTAMDEMMSKGTPEQLQSVTEAFLKMKKFDLAELEKAYKG